MDSTNPPDVDSAAPQPVLGIENAVHAALARVAKEFAGGSSEGSGSLDPWHKPKIANVVRPQTAQERVLVHTLTLFGWTGEGRWLREALPHFDHVGDLEALRCVLARLGFLTRKDRIKLRDLRPDMMPCLYSPDGRDVLIVLEEGEGGELLVYEGASDSWKYIQPTAGGQAVHITQPSEEETPQSERSLLLDTCIKFRRLIGEIFLISFVSNTMALTVPIFVIFVYDLGIGTKTTNTVYMLALGACIVLATNVALRSIRAYAIAYLGTRIDAFIGVGAFESLLKMPIAMVETAPVSTGHPTAAS